MRTPRNEYRNQKRELDRAVLQTGQITRMTALWCVWFERPELRDAAWREIEWEDVKRDREDRVFLDYLDRTYGRLV